MANTRHIINESRTLGSLQRLLSTLIWSAQEEEPSVLELPWRRNWNRFPKRTAGRDFSRQDYAQAYANARLVARTTLGEENWNLLQRQGYLDHRSQLMPGITYRLRVGRRIEVRCAPGVQSPWTYRYLCINPTYPLPEEEFLAHLYLYIRDREEEIIRVAAPQPWDQPLGRTF